MPPIWLILTFVAVVLYDVNVAAPFIENLTTLETFILTLGPIAVISLIAAARVLQLGAAIFRAKPDAHIKAARADRWSRIARAAPAAWIIASVYLFGWLDAVRNIVGDSIAIDELLAILPVIIAAIISWAAYHPINHRLREIAITSTLFSGKPTPPLPTLSQYITDQLRNRVALGLVILTALLAWRETIERILPEQQIQTNTTELTQAALQLLGVACVLLLSPLAARLAWSTQPLPPGELRDNLKHMCRQHNVKIRNILVWRTHGTTLNAAVMGLIPHLRYVLLTDALIDELREDRLEAVMAHELGHVRCNHMPWLIASLIALVTTATVAFAIPAEFAIKLAELPDSAADAAAALATVLGLATGILAFGFISRRFEWQADAFGAKHGSTPHSTAMQRQQQATPQPWTWSTPNPLAPTASTWQTFDLSYDSPQQPTNQESIPTTQNITKQAAEAMAGALSDVARYNHAETHRFGFLHGSIHHRQTRLKKLVGLPTNKLPIDRTVRRLKRTVATLLIAVIALTIWDVRNTIEHNNRLEQHRQQAEQERQEAIDQLRRTGEAAITGFFDGFRQRPQQQTTPAQEQTP